MSNTRRVLVADDDTLVRMVMADTLKDAGYEVLEAADGNEACRLVEEPERVDIVVTDLNMPGSDGTVVARHARRHHADIPVLFVSGRPDLMAQLPFSYNYLPKPFSMQQLANTVHAMLGECRERHRDQ